MNMNMFMLNLMLEGATGSNWSIGNFIASLQGSMVNYVKIIVTIIGVVMVGFGTYQIAKNLISHGKGQTNWVVTFALIVIGGTLMLTSGFGVLQSFGRAGKTSIENLGSGNADNSNKGMTKLDTMIIGDNIVTFNLE